MPQSLASIPIHFIWSTKDRHPFIKSEIQAELYKYMAGIFRAHESPALIINGTENHIHALSIISRKITVAKLVEQVKKSSSKWVKTQGTLYQKFYWQHGYAAFGIGQSNIDDLKAYIANQEEHHHRRTFQEEYIAFLRKYDVEYDERCVWD
ncbi:MAG TPA: IS200/IS605 family transposase [bacterium]|nr:IS200/IS605 family transposase [bacterium]